LLFLVSLTGNISSNFCELYATRIDYKLGTYFVSRLKAVLLHFCDFESRFGCVSSLVFLRCHCWARQDLHRHDELAGRYTDGYSFAAKFPKCSTVIHLSVPQSSSMAMPDPSVAGSCSKYRNTWRGSGTCSVRVGIRHRRRPSAS